MDRRRFIKAGAIGSLGVAGQAIANNDQLMISQPTPPEIEGPFYPLVAQKDIDFDLTKISGHKMEALGKHVNIHGKVIDTEGKAVEGATVDLWQANAAGKYAHPHDSSTAPIDNNFQGWAIVPSGLDGGFQFKTVLPGVYPVEADWTRPPHIHFKVTKRGYVDLVTQMYFPGQPLNKIDRLLQNKSNEEKELMIAKQQSDKPNTFYYQIVIEKV